MKKKAGSNNSLNNFSLPSSPVTGNTANYINNSVTSSIVVSSVSGTQPPSMSIAGQTSAEYNYPLPPIPDSLKVSQTNLFRHVSDGAKPSKNQLISQLSTIDSESETLSDLKTHLLLTEKLKQIQEGLKASGDGVPDEILDDFDAFDVSLPNPIIEDNDDANALNAAIASIYVVTAVFDYVGSEKEELSFKEGEKMKVFPEKSIKLEDDTVAWYWAVKESGDFGFIPSNYVEYEESTSRLVSMYEESVPEVIRKVCSFIEEKGKAPIRKFQFTL